MENETKADPRVKRTRRLLQQAMNDLMHEKSFSDITVQDITARADVNRATFYAHFVDKYDLVNAIIRDRFQAMLDDKLSEQPVFTRENLYLLIQTVYAYLDGFPGQCSTAHLHREQGLMVQQVQIQTYTVLLEWLSRVPSSAKSGSVSAEVAAMMISWAIFGPIVQSSWGSHKMPSQQLIDQMMTLIQSVFEQYMARSHALQG